MSEGYRHELALREIRKEEQADRRTWRLLQVALVAVLLSIAFATAGCSTLAVGAIGGWANVHKHLAIGARKSYEMAIWGWDGPPATHVGYYPSTQ